jgi:hypothetical protein
MKKLFSITALALMLAVTASTQTSSSSLAGTVADSTNRVVPGASVTLTNEASGEERKVTTNENGEFVFAGIMPGIYTVKVQSTGFRPLERRGNVLVSSSRLALGTMQLDVGALAESVQVTAQGAQVQTDSAEHSELVDSKEIDNVSIRGRDPISLLAIMPGAQKGFDPDFLGASYGSPVPAFQGLNSNTNVMMVNGVNGGDGGGGGFFSGTVNLDSIGEVRVLMSNYNAEYGRSGGAVINMITKSGGKQFHGAGWLNKRHEELNANNYFNNATGLGKPIYRFQTFGGDVGGPLKLPVINRTGDKFFFFVLFEDSRVKNPTSIEYWTMPTALERQGNFSQSLDLNGRLISVKDPLTNQPFPGNVIPQSRVNQNGLAILNILPLPNVNATGYNYLFQERYINQPRQSITTREDYRPTDKDTITFTLNTWNADSSGIHVAAGSSLWGLLPMRYAFETNQATVNYTRVITPHLINEFFIGAMHDREESPPLPPLGYGPLQRQNRGLSGLGQYNSTWNPLNFVPKASFGGIPTAFPPSVPAGLTNGAHISFDGREPLSGFDTNFTGSNNITYTRGGHTFKAGVYFEHSRFGQAATSNFSGTYDFSNSSLDPTNTGYAWANAYIGHFASYTEDLGRGPDNSRRRTWAWFGQDTWKVARNLTMDVGLRVYRVTWPLQSDGVASEIALSRFDPSWQGNPPVLFRPINTPDGRRGVNPLTGDIFPASYIGNIVPGTGESCNAIPCKLNGIVLQNDTSFESNKGFRDSLPLQWDPRLGISWDPFGTGKTAIRASFGVFHQASTGGTGALNRGPAFVYTRTLLSSDITPAQFQTTPLSSPINVSGVYQKQKLPVVYQYQLGIQRDIGRSLVFDIAYIGNTEHYITQNWNYNYVPLGTRFKPEFADPTNPAVALPSAFLRPNAGYLDTIVSGPATSTHYNALQTKIQRRFAAGVEIDANYTWSKMLQATGWSQELPQKLFYGPVTCSSQTSCTSIDQTHVFNFSYVYELPKASKLFPSPVAKWALDGWQTSGVTTFASGFPQNIILTTTDNFDFTGGGEMPGAGAANSSAPIPLGGVALSCSPQLPHGSRTGTRFFDTSCVHRPSGRGDYGSDFTNSKFRGPGFNNWDMSIFKNFPVREGKILTFRWEAYNIFNHTQWGPALSSAATTPGINNTARFDPAGNQVNPLFGQATSTRPERRMQGSLRFTF